MKYHYGEGWVTFYYRFSMSINEARNLGLISYYYQPGYREYNHYLEIQDWLAENIGMAEKDWFFNVQYKDNTVWFGFNKKSHTELFRLVWG